MATRPSSSTGSRVGFIDRLEIAWRHQIDSGLLARAQHQPSQADIGPAGFGIDDVVDRGGYVGAAVGAVLEMHRQLSDVGVIAGQNHLLARRLGARDIDNVWLVAQPPLDFLQQGIRLDPERCRNTGAASHHATDKLRSLGTGGAEQHGLGITLQHFSDAAELDRLVARIEFVHACEVFDESPQPESVEVRRVRLQVRSGFLNDIHRRPPLAEL